MKLFVGIDVSSEKLDVCFLNDDGVILSDLALSNNILGASIIKTEVLKLHKLYNYKRIVIGMESTSIYSHHPSTFLHEDKDLKSLGVVEVLVLNPKNIKKYGDIFDEDKTDRIDARHIAEFLSLQRFKTSVIKEEKYVALQRLTRSRSQLISQVNKCKMHFLENLYYKCNTLAKELKEDAGTSPHGAALTDFLTEFLSLDEIAQMELEDLAALLQEKGRGRFKNPENIAKVIKNAIRNSYRLGDMLQESVDVVLAMYVDTIKTLNKQIKVLDKAIERLAEAIPEIQILRSIPGIGPVYAAGIIAEIGQIERFDNDTKIAKYAGLHWKKKQSGKVESERTSLTFTGNKFLRYYLVEAANSVRLREPVYCDYYRKKYSEVPKHRHKRALVLTARKLVRLVDVLLRNHQLYTLDRSG